MFATITTVMKNTIKYCLIILTLVVFLLPLMQDYIFNFKFKALHGVIVKTKKPEPTFKSLYSGDYQTKMEKYISENYGFREPMIRFYNQYLWDFYNVSPVKTLFLGKDNWMYLERNVREYYGTEVYRYFNSPEKAREAFIRRARILNKLRLVLKNYGIELLVFEAPEKGYLYSEFLPDGERDTTSINPIEFYTERFQSYGVPFIGMTNYFEKIKDTTEFPLFSKHGFHWNISCVYGVDTLFRTMESLHGASMPHLYLENLRPLTIDDEEYTKDNDIEQTLNLMRFIKYKGKPQMTADVRIETDSTFVKPRMFFIGDSFFWKIQSTVDLNKVFDESRFWFYNSTTHSGKNLKIKKPAKEFSRLREIFKSDYIVFILHGGNLYKLSMDFCEQALIDICVPDSIMNREIQRVSDSANVSAAKAKELIIGNPELIPELRSEAAPTIRNTRGIAIAQTMNRIEQDPDWMNVMKIVAHRKSLAVDTIMRHEAINVIDNKPLMLNNTIMSDSLYEDLYRYEIDSIVESMKNKPKLMESIRNKALKNGNTVEDQLLKDAIWVYNHKKE